MKLRINNDQSQLRGKKNGKQKGGELTRVKFYTDTETNKVKNEKKEGNIENKDTNKTRGVIKLPSLLLGNIHSKLPHL